MHEHNTENFIYNAFFARFVVQMCSVYICVHWLSLCKYCTSIYNLFVSSYAYSFVCAGGRVLQRVLPAGRRLGQEELAAGGGDADAAGGADAVDSVPAGGEQEEERARRLHLSRLLPAEPRRRHGPPGVRRGRRAQSRRVAARPLGEARHRVAPLARHLSRAPLLLLLTRTRAH